jgi:hypothetical protein
LQACFRDEAQFGRFSAGEAFSNGLANINDAEYSAHYHRMVMASRALVNSGQVQSGTVARLETVPVPFLRKVPLLEGAWLDRHVAELAEYGSLLHIKGYEASEDQDEHPLVSVQFISHDGKEVDQVVHDKLFQSAAGASRISRKSQGAPRTTQPPTSP